MSAEFDAYQFTTLGGVAPLRPIAPPGQANIEDIVARRDMMAIPVDGPKGEQLLEAAKAEHANNIDSVGIVPFKDSVSEKTGLEWWFVSSPHNYHDQLLKADTGVMAVVNWDEAGTKHGSFLTFNNLNPDTTKLLVGPAQHCDWSTVKSETGFDLVVEELRFFDYWLKDIDNGVMDEDPVTYYTYNAASENEWKTSKSWPLAEEERQPLYLSSANLLVGNKFDEEGKIAVSFSDRPLSQTVTISRNKTATAFLTEPLEAPLQITGHPVINVWISSQESDADITATLVDVAPDGEERSYQMLGRLRASHRTTSTAPYDTLGLPWRTHLSEDASSLPTDQPVKLSFEMLPISYVFEEGHQIKLEIAVTDPESAKGNTNKFVNILTGGEHASYVELPVIPLQNQMNSEIEQAAMRQTIQRDMSKLLSEAPEPEGPGTALGPHTNVNIEPVPGLGSHTVFYPTDVNSPMPLVVWGNGACRNDGRMFEKTLTKVASHGYVVIAAGEFDPSHQNPTKGKHLIEAIDWAEAHTAVNEVSPYKIDSSKIAVMGQSCGGLMTIEAAYDQRIDTIAVINSGVFVGPGGLSLSTATKETLKSIHTPVLYIDGGARDAAYENATDDVERINHVPVFYGSMNDAGHFATHKDKNGGRFAEVITDWLDWQLKSDSAAAKVFIGDDCELCVDPEWTYKTKNITQQR